MIDGNLTSKEASLSITDLTQKFIERMQEEANQRVAQSLLVLMIIDKLTILINY